MNISKAIILALFVYFQTNGQTVKDVFEKQELTWYGIDFSMAKFVGDFDQISFADNLNASQIRDVYFKSWNEVVINEKSKYDLPTFYQKQLVLVDLTSVEKQNQAVNPDSMMYWGTPKKLSIEQIQSTVGKYKATSSSKLGLVFIVEKFDKTNQIAIIHVVFFDTENKKILLAKKLQEKPAGFGLRNYWIRTIYNAMTTSSKQWKKWRKEAIPKR